MNWQNYPAYNAPRIDPIRLDPVDRPPGVYINPCAYTRSELPHLDMTPVLDARERMLVMILLRRYVTWCARSRRYPQMQGAANLFRRVSADRPAARLRVVGVAT